MMRFCLLAFLFLIIYLNGSEVFGSRNIRIPQKTVQIGYPKPLQKMILTPLNKAIVYFDTSGVNAIDTVDSDRNGIPDFVTIVANVLDNVWRFEIDSLGHKAPINPGWWNKPIPIYLNEDNLTYGGTYFLFPGTIEGDFTKFVSYIKINPALSKAQNKGEIERAIKVTIAHELYHAIQFSYGVRYKNNEFKDLWLLESTATAFEEFVYGEINDYYQYLPDIQNYPWENGLTSKSRFSYYGHCLFFLMLAQQMNNLEIMKSIWVNQDLYPGFEMLSFLASQQKKTLNEVLLNYLLWRYYTGDNWRSGFFEEGGNYPPLKTFYHDSISQLYPINSLKNWGVEVHKLNSNVNGFVEPSGYPVLSIKNVSQGRWTRPDLPLAINKNLDYIICFWDGDIPVSFGPEVELSTQVIPNPVFSSYGSVFIIGALALEKIIVYNILGQKIVTLQASDTGHAQWNLTNQNNQRVGSGNYFIYYSETGFVDKCIILK